MRYNAKRGASQMPTEVDPARRRTGIELEAQVEQLADGARYHLVVTAHHSHVLRWVVVGVACATVLSLVAVASAAYSVAWLVLGGGT